MTFSPLAKNASGISEALAPYIPMVLAPFIYPISSANVPFTSVEAVIYTTVALLELTHFLRQGVGVHRHPQGEI